MALVLTPADLSDLPQVVQLMNRAYRGAGADAGWSTEARFLSGDRTTEALLLEEIEGKPQGVLLVAQAAGEPMLGCVWMEAIGEGTWYLGSLTVDPLRQNRGLGRELLSAAEEWAAARGGRTVQMKVINIREGVIAWYERRGYRLTGATTPFPYSDTRFGVPLRDDLAFVVLQRTLQPADAAETPSK